MQTKLRADRMAETFTPIVLRIANDEELRGHAKTAMDSARTIYDRMQRDGARSAAMRKDVQDEIVRAATELRTTAALLANSQQPRRTHKLRNLVLASAIVIGAAAAIKTLLGSDEDEFDYEP